MKSLFRADKALAEIRAHSEDRIPGKVRDVYGDLCFPPAPPDRPYTFGSIVLSADGKMAYYDDPRGPVIAGSNRLDPAGAQADFWVLNMLRAYSDAVITGARTIGAEPESTAHVFCEELAEARTGLMQKPTAHPINIVVSLDGTDIPVDHRIFNSANLFSLIATSEAGGQYLDGVLGGRPRRLLGPYRSGEEADAGDVWRYITEDPSVLCILTTGRDTEGDAAVLFALLRRMGIRRLCIESPAYMWFLLKNRALDEIFVNYSLVFAGGGIAMGSAQPFGSLHHPHSELLTLGIHKENFIFSRQRLRYEEADPVATGREETC
ncbi:MAG: pyrimidine reductase [Treponema sp.]|nr:pyrimidine reductase [Treponema sp.]